ncbi:MAG: hypothetical protein ACI841_002792 [Planctomycetota bacterium]|jgi:hypothetical protein
MDGAPATQDEQMNQRTSTPLGSMEYGGNGNLTRVDAGQPDEVLVEYDYRNRMVVFTDADTGEQTTHAFDALGRRATRVDPPRLQTTTSLASLRRA